MKTFLIGIILGGLLLIISLFLENPDMIMYILLILGIVPIVIAGLITGAFVSGDRMRANHSDFSERSSIGSKLFLFGIPCLVAGIIIHFI